MMISTLLLLFCIIGLILAIPYVSRVVTAAAIHYKHKQDQKQAARQWEALLDGLADKYRGMPFYGPEEYKQPQRWKHYPDAITDCGTSTRYAPSLNSMLGPYSGHRHYKKGNDHD